MSQDTILKNKNGIRYSFDSIKTQGWLNGHAPGVEMAAKWLRERATMLFNAKKDSEASTLRDLADKMETELVAACHKDATEYSTSHPYVLDGPE
jgi:hypothetical protein